MVSDLGEISSDHNSPIVASGRSVFETLTGFVNPTGLGNLTVKLQVQGGGNSSSEENVTSSPLNIEYCVTAPSYHLIAESLLLYNLIPLMAPLKYWSKSKCFSGYHAPPPPKKNGQNGS